MDTAAMRSMADTDMRAAQRGCTIPDIGWECRIPDITRIRALAAPRIAVTQRVRTMRAVRQVGGTRQMPADLSNPAVLIMPRVPVEPGVLMPEAGKRKRIAASRADPRAAITDAPLLNLATPAAHPLVTREAQDGAPDLPVTAGPRRLLTRTPRAHTTPLQNHRGVRMAAADIAT